MLASRGAFFEGCSRRFLRVLNRLLDQRNRAHQTTPFEMRRKIR